MSKHSRSQGVSQAPGKLLHCVLLGLAAVCGLWSITASVDRLKWGGAGVRAIAARVWANEEFKGDALTRVLSAAEAAKGSGCPLAAQGESLTIIAYGNAKTALSSDGKANSAERLIVAENQARAALACSPHRGALWFFLFWAKIQQTKLQSTDLPLLWMSYRLAPHEGWLQALRSPFVMRFFDALPPEGRLLALTEFGELVESGRANRTAATFAELSPSVRERLLPIIERVSQPKRQQFGSALQELGLDVQINGVSDPNRERWEHYISAVDKVRDVLKKVSKVPERAEIQTE